MLSSQIITEFIFLKNILNFLGSQKASINLFQVNLNKPRNFQWCCYEKVHPPSPLHSRCPQLQMIFYVYAEMKNLGSRYKHIVFNTRVIPTTNIAAYLQILFWASFFSLMKARACKTVTFSWNSIRLFSDAVKCAICETEPLSKTSENGTFETQFFCLRQQICQKRVYPTLTNTLS